MKAKLYRRMWTALDWVLPPACAGCGKPGDRWCPTCHADSPRVETPGCVLCGQVHAEGECERVPWLNRAGVWGLHKGPLRKAIHRLKYARDVALGEALSACLLEVAGDWEADTVIPIALAPKRVRQRGYNQAVLLAYPLALALDLPYAAKALRRVRETASQVGLTLAERRENVSGAFWADGRRVGGKRVLLVDDVLTTDSTLDAAAQALKAAGAVRVDAAVVSRAVFKSRLEA